MPNLRSASIAPKFGFWKSMVVGYITYGSWQAYKLHKFYPIVDKAIEEQKLMILQRRREKLSGVGGAKQ